MIPQLNRYSNHYQAPFMTRCGQGVLVFYEGAPKNGKTQLDEHEETCPKCLDLQKKESLPLSAYNFSKWYYGRYNINPEELNLFRKIEPEGKIIYLLSNLQIINEYEKLGKISQEELEVLRKFDIANDRNR